MLYHVNKLAYVTPASVAQTKKGQKPMTKKSLQWPSAKIQYIQRACLQGQRVSQGVNQHIVTTTWMFFLSLRSETYLESIYTLFQCRGFLCVCWLGWTVQIAPLDMLGVPTSPSSLGCCRCWWGPCYNSNIILVFLTTFNAPQVPCSGGALPSSLFPSLVALPVPESKQCSARACSDSCLQTTQPSKVVLEALWTTQVPLSDQQDFEWMRMS